MGIEQVKLLVGMILGVTFLLLAAVGIPILCRVLKRRGERSAVQMPDHSDALPEPPEQKLHWFKRYRNTLLVGIFLVVLFTGVFIMDQVTLNCTEPTLAVVIETETQTGDGGDEYYIARVAYDVENRSRKAKVKHPVHHWVVGETVEILYNPDHPSFVALRNNVEDAQWNRSVPGGLIGMVICIVFAAVFLSVAVSLDKKRALRKKQPAAPKKENRKIRKLFKRWQVPLLLAVICLIWEVAACGIQSSFIVKCVSGYVGIGMFYNWLMSWLKDKPGQKPPTIELVLALPIFAMLLFFTVPPFPYIRPWILTAAFAVAGFEGWAFGLGYWVQGKGMQKTCTTQTTAVVLSNIEERVSNRKRPGDISPPTYFPVLVYYVQGERMERKYDHGQPRPMEVDRRIEICYNPKKPEEFCFQDQKENKALTLGAPFFLLIGTLFVAVAVLSVKYQWHF